MEPERKKGLFLDPYERPARLYPSLLVFAPLAVLLVCLYGEENILASSILSILSFCGVAFALCQLARNAGIPLQDKLFSRWGGAPTTQLFRHRNNRIDKYTKARYHAILSTSLGIQMPSRQNEKENPDAADELYKAAIAWLRERTRNKDQFPLVFKENVAFGFLRNALGLRWLGFGISIICMGWVMIHERILILTHPYFAQEPLYRLPPPAIISFIVSISLACMWLFFINESAVKRVGYAYAERLLESCNRIKIN